MLDASPLGDWRFELFQPMAGTRSDVASVVESTRLVAAGGAVAAVHFLGRTAAFVLSEKALGSPSRTARCVEGDDTAAKIAARRYQT